ncbi:TPA: hypothetical protein NHK44_005861 [Pseudomonas aeruginosa]|nr:hypothetical protein [Pseudomonas aeruginosa]
MSQTVAEAQAAYDAARSALLNELERDIERPEGSGAQERRREEHQQALRDEEDRCKRALENAKAREKQAQEMASGD